MQVPAHFKPRKYQFEVLQALDGGKKRCILVWHRRAGKDKLSYAYMIKEAATTPGNYFYIFPTKEMAKRALWENVDKDGFKLMDHLPQELRASVNNQELLLKLTNGSTIRIIGLDTNPDAIRGVAAKGVVLSEFAYSDPEAYKILVPSIEEAQGWVIINSTPNGRNHFYDRFKQALKSPEWSVSFLQTLWPDRPNYSGLVSPEDLARIEESEGLSREHMEREFGCSFETGMEGSYYSNQIDKAHKDKRIAYFPYNDHCWVDTFWDLGISDSTAIWFRQINNGRVEFIDYYEDSGKSVAHYVDVMKMKGYRYRTHFLPHDGNHQKDTGTSIKTTRELLQDCLSQANLSDDVVVNPKLPIQDGINAVRSRFSLYHFDVENCAAGLKAIELYHKRYDKKRATYIATPEHDWSSHAADALRMEGIAEQYYEDTEFETLRKQVFTDFNPFED